MEMPLAIRTAHLIQPIREHLYYTLLGNNCRDWCINQIHDSRLFAKTGSGHATFLVVQAGCRDVLANVFESVVQCIDVN